MKIWPFDGYAENSNGTDISSAQMRTGLGTLEQIRAAVGDQMDVMVELHSLWNIPMARKIIAALGEYRPYWIEDPGRSDIHGGLHAVAGGISAASTMLAVGKTAAQPSTFIPLTSG